jgi:hypothetical protein
VKWKGFLYETNSWEKRKDISTKLADQFDTFYLESSGTRIGMEPLDKRISVSRMAGLYWMMLRQPDRAPRADTELFIFIRLQEKTY